MNESSYERDLAEGKREAVTLTGAEAQAQMDRELMELTHTNSIDQARAVLLKKTPVKTKPHDESTGS